MNAKNNNSARGYGILFCATWITLLSVSCVSKSSALAEETGNENFPMTPVKRIVVVKNERFVNRGEPIRLEIEDPKIFKEILSYLYPSTTDAVYFGRPPKWHVEFLRDDDSVVTLYIEKTLWTAEKQNLSGGVKEGFDEYMSYLFYTAIPANIKIQP